MEFHTPILLPHDVERAKELVAELKACGNRFYSLQGLEVFELRSRNRSLVGEHIAYILGDRDPKQLMDELKHAIEKQIVNDLIRAVEDKCNADEM